MYNQLDVATVYHQAQRNGKRYLSEHAADGFLPVLEPLLTESCGEIPLGVMEIPLKKIRGTYAAGRSTAFAGNFMPLLNEDSEFASKWTTLYLSAAAEGIREAIRVYEYLGYYYAVEGNKRVSVAHCLGAVSISADVTRLLPPAGQHDTEHLIYEEILAGGKRVCIDMWFSKPGRMTELRALAEKQVPPDEVEEHLRHSYALFRSEYHKLGYHRELEALTTGDAFWQYVTIYGFPSYDNMAQLPGHIKTCQPQFRSLVERPPARLVENVSDLGKQSAVQAFFFRHPKLRILFAYGGRPETRFSTRAHSSACYLLRRAMPELGIDEVYDVPTDESGYEVMLRAVEEHAPTLLFVTDTALGVPALRLALELRDTMVLHCHDRRLGLMGSYYGKTGENAYLMGVLAGSLSHSGRIGYIRPEPSLGGRNHDMQAFAQGATLLRPAARLTFSVPDRRRRGDLAPLLQAFAREGIDMVWLPLSPRPYALKSAPGVYAHLCTLGPTGALGPQLACASWHWDSFYQNLAVEILAGTPDFFSPHGDKLHFRLGVSAGLLDVHPYLPQLGLRSVQLLAHFRTLLEGGTLHSLDREQLVEVHELQP